ncbi:MAG TPA: nuclear transport factor 2 family protein [Pyrinomonadaceae bacterium]|nr:nuclear transport factor 2 family protein [Pyrinomonadaceae bacterium]
MKRLLVLVSVVLALTCSPAPVAQSQTPESQVVSAERKVKLKNAKPIVRDKSKPVRKALEDWYARNIAAFKAKDVTAVMALRTEDFQTYTPDGKVNTRSDMEAYTQRFLGRIDHFISLDFGIGTIKVDGELASADVTQATARMQHLPDGTLHKVEARAVQIETWRNTSTGWKLYRVDNVRSTGLLVDDKPYQPYK